jgi:hypothetical protein
MPRLALPRNDGSVSGYGGMEAGRDTPGMSRLDRGGWALTLVGVVLLRFDGFIVYRPDLNHEERLWPPLLELLAPVPA